MSAAGKLNTESGANLAGILDAADFVIPCRVPAKNPI